MKRGEEKESKWTTWFLFKRKYRFFRLYNSSFIAKSDCFILFYVLIRKRSETKMNLNKSNLCTQLCRNKATLRITWIIWKQLSIFCKHVFVKQKSILIVCKISKFYRIFGLLSPFLYLQSKRSNGWSQKNKKQQK